MQGGYFAGKYFHCLFPDRVIDKKPNICVLELLSIIIALRLWQTELKGKCIVVNCDNEAVCYALNTGKSRCTLLQQGIREVCYLTAVAQCQIRGVHIAGTQNRLADCLSRWDLDYRHQLEFYKLTQNVEIQECHVQDFMFDFILS